MTYTGLRMATALPENAIAVNFQFGKTLHGKFYVWETKGGKWQWHAMGNDGEADSYEKAIAAAREWIIYDYNPSL